jgi:outer membrane lipoprotein
MSPRIVLSALATPLAALLLAGCASQVPLLIRQGPADSPTPAEVRVHPGDYRGRTVRWGGLLIATGNLAQATRLTLLARPLTRDGEPALGDASLGRFIAIVPAFLDPQVYATDRLVTVTGTVLGSETARVGDHAYIYPLVEAQAWYLWPEPEAPYGYPYPWWYDPWYGPWWYGSWYDPWYSPWYYPRWYPHHHRPHKPGPPDTAPPSETRPEPHRPGHPRHEPRAPHERPQTGIAPSPRREMAPPRGDRPVERRQPETRVPPHRPAAGTRPAPARDTAPSRETPPVTEPPATGTAAPPARTDVERQRHERHAPRVRPHAGAVRREVPEQRQERLERGMERSAPEPARMMEPDTDRGFRGPFRRWRDD